MEGGNHTSRIRNPLVDGSLTRFSGSIFPGAGFKLENGSGREKIDCFCIDESDEGKSTECGDNYGKRRPSSGNFHCARSRRW